MKINITNSNRSTSKIRIALLLSAGIALAGLTGCDQNSGASQSSSASDPLNTTHVAMPPKGGNPALSPQDISDIVAYVRELQKHTAPDHLVNTTELKKKPTPFE